jgi:hypothetical protein
MFKEPRIDPDRVARHSSDDDSILSPRLRSDFMENAVAGATFGVLPSSLTADDLMRVAEARFSPVQASTTMWDSFLRTTGKEETRDYTLLELTIPFLDGVFSSDCAIDDAPTTPRLTRQDPLSDLVAVRTGTSLSDAASCADACAYLRRSTWGDLYWILFKERVSHFEPFGPLFAGAGSFLFCASLAVKSAGKGGPTFRQATQICELFRVGVRNLQEDPRVYVPVAQYLEEEQKSAT